MSLHLYTVKTFKLTLPVIYDMNSNTVCVLHVKAHSVTLCTTVTCVLASCYKFQVSSMECTCSKCVLVLL